MNRAFKVGFLVAVMALFGSSCGGSSNSTAPPRDVGQVADRFADLVDDERETVLIAPADQDIGHYDIAPASFDTVIVRAEPGSDNKDRAVDVLLKGSFPDGCTELHEIAQRVTPEGRSVILTMRRPQGAMCTQVVRPYRYFFVLDGRFGLGAYELTVNDRTFPFSVE